MGLRVKLGLFIVGFVFVVLNLVAYAQLRGEREILLRETEERGKKLLKTLAVPCAIAMANNDITTLDNYIVKFEEDAAALDLRYIAALDIQGQVKAHTRVGEFGKVQDDPFTRRAMASNVPVVEERHVDDEPVLVVAVPVVSGLRWGTLKAGFTLVPLELELERRRNRAVLVSVAISLGVAAVIYLMLSVMVIQPVIRMEGMARAFGGGDLEARIQLKTNDEMGQLAQRLNGMAQQIQDYTNSLEQRVQERTSELAAANTKLLDVNRQLDRLAKTDPLTGLYNRRHFMEQLEFEIRRGARTQRQFSLAMMDVDHFKNYNDTNGHTAGDELLQRLATLLELNLRSVDLVARFGGEEFIVLLLDTGPEEGHATSVKLQEVVAAQPFPFEESQPGGKLTVSVGVAFYPADSRNARTLIEDADQAMYRSKADGRNRVTRWTDLKNT